MPQILTPREILAQLVSFPTVSHSSNLDLIDWLETYLASHAIPTARHWNEDRGKAALLAHAGPLQAGGVVLSGHSDVVPVAGQNWTSDPFELTQRGDRLYGRGVCDMKGYVALSVWALVEAQRLGVQRPLQLALSYDEEVGCTGAGPMLETLQAVFPKASVALIGEPSRMQPIQAHKGGVGYQVAVKGFEVHSSLLPYGVSAIMEGARLIGWVNDRNTALQGAQPSALAARFDPPFTTLHVGMISGGTAHNITAADCRFAVEMRVVPGEDLEALAAEFEVAALTLTGIPMRAFICSASFACPPCSPNRRARPKPSCAASPGPMRAGLYLTAPRRVFSKRRAIPPWSVGRAILPKPISPTNTLTCRSLRRAKPLWPAC